MLMEVKKNLNLIFVSLKFNILKEMEYRVAFISQIIGMILNNGSFIIQWIILFSLKDDFGGYVLKDIMMLWAVAAGSYGLNRTVFGNVTNLSDYITKGKLDTYLVQPKNVLINILASRTSAGAIGDIIYGYLVLIVLKSSITTYLLYTLVIILGAIVHTAFVVITQSLAFWLGRADSIASALENAIMMPSTYPEGIFNSFVKIAMFTIIPVGFIVFIPVRLLNLFDPLLLLGLVGFTVSITLLAFLVFNKGLKKYSSSNLMIVRI